MPLCAWLLLPLPFRKELRPELRPLSFPQNVGRMLVGLSGGVAATKRSDECSMLNSDELSAYHPIWRASDALLYGVDFVLRYARPMTIFETGVGATSLLIQKYCKAMGPQTVYQALESPGPWIDIHRGHLRRFGLDDSGVHVCPVTDDYVTDGFELRSPRLDLVLLDGPASSQLRGRHRVLELVRPRVHTRTVFVVDDTHRRRERVVCEILMSWFAAGHLTPIVLPDRIHAPRSSTLLLPALR